MQLFRRWVAAVIGLIFLGPLSVAAVDVSTFSADEIRSWLKAPTEETVLRLARVLRDAQSSPLPISPRVLEEVLFGLAECPIRVPEEYEVLKEIRFMIDHHEPLVRHAALRALVLRYRTWKAAREMVQGLSPEKVGEDLHRWACEQMLIVNSSGAAKQERLELILDDVRRQWAVMHWMPRPEARRRLEDWIRFQPGVGRVDVGSETVEIETVDGQTGTLLLLTR